MSDWTWEYVPDTASVVGGLTSEQITEVEALAARLADAVGVRRLIWFLEDYRDDVVLVVRVQHLGVL